ncbi:competence protein ComK [Metabacillus idriensis]|uniref:competence protein ComK n=1 Tax=Metabacillus idriensis TaxID=324768 RepID=UPI003D2BD6EF
MLMKESYAVWRETMAVKPMYTENGELWSVVHELYKKLIVKMSPREIMNRSCIHAGASYQGMIEAAKLILPGKKMLPVCLSPGFRICMVPTLSPDSEECIWVSYHHVKKIFEKNNRTMIECRNKEEIEIQGSVESYLTKAGYAQQLVLTYLDRQEEMWDLTAHLAETYEGYEVY